MVVYRDLVHDLPQKPSMNQAMNYYFSRVERGDAHAKNLDINAH